MILYEIFNSEDNPAYQALEVSNLIRQYDFLKSIVESSAALQRPYLSQQVIKALNYHAIICLHTNPGEYRPCPVKVGEYRPPDHFRVEALMEDFVNEVNRSWGAMDPVALATYVLWRMTYIHPFINGNGRTARATCYFILCLHSNAWLPGDTILPELIRRDRAEYIAALQAADNSFNAGNLDLSLLHNFLTRLLEEQLHGSPSPNAEAVSPEQPAIE